MEERTIMDGRERELDEVTQCLEVVPAFCDRFQIGVSGPRPSRTLVNCSKTWTSLGHVFHPFSGLSSLSDNKPMS